MSKQAADVKVAPPPSPLVMNTSKHQQNHNTLQPGQIDKLTFSDTLYRIRCGEFFTHNDPLYGYRSKSRQSHINKFKAEFKSNPEKSAQIEATLAMRKVYRKIRHLSEGKNRKKTPTYRENYTIDLKEEFKKVQTGTMIREAIEKLINTEYNCDATTDGLTRLCTRMQTIDAQLAKQTKMKIDSKDVTTLFDAAKEVGNDGMIVQKKTKRKTRMGRVKKGSSTRSERINPHIPEKPTQQVSSMSTAGRGAATQRRGDISSNRQLPGCRL